MTAEIYFLNAEMSRARVRLCSPLRGPVSTWILPPDGAPMSRFLFGDLCHSSGLILCSLAFSPLANVSVGLASTKAAKRNPLSVFI